MLFRSYQFEQFRQQRIEESNGHLIQNLMIVNLVTLGLGGGAAYLLARRTLRPIQEVMEMQGRFTSDASHELRTPLASMQSEIEVALRNEKLGKTQMRALLVSNLEEVNRLRGLSDRLLDLSNSQTITPVATDLESVIGEVLDRNLARADEKHIAIDVNVGQFTVLADQAMLGDLLSILTENAIKYSPEKTKIRIEAEEKGRTIEMRVVDQGIGIAQDDVDRIFDRFYRADSSRTSQTVKGYGLGLSIAKRIADLHNTHIVIVSQLDKGTTFSFALPKAAPVNRV